MILLTRRKIMQITFTCIAVIGIAVTVPFVVTAARSGKINNDVSLLKENDKYKKKVEVEGIEAVESGNSADYAVIEMISSWKENENASADIKSSENVLFTNEFAKKLEEETSTEVKTYEYLTNTGLLDIAYDSIENGNPVALEWAYKDNDEWKIDYSLMTGLDIQNDNATVYNPDGYFETITIHELVERTSFEIVEEMPFTLSVGFAYGAYSKNTVFVLQ